MRFLSALVITAALLALSPAVESASARTYVLCTDSNGDTVNRAKPSVCNFHVASNGNARAAAADYVYVLKLHWRSWGGSKATASGVFAGNMDVREKGTVTLSGRKRCTGYGYVYTQFRMKFPHSSGFNFRLDGCA